MADDKQPSNWQQAIDGEWHGCPSLFEHDGTWVGTNKVSRASEFKDGRTTYWMDTRFDAAGPLMDRFEIGSRMEFGVIDSDQDRIYTGPDFVGSGRPFGLLVDSRYYSPGWNVDLRTVNHVVPELGMQVYSSQLFEADTLVGVFNGLYIVTQDHDSNPQTQERVSNWIEEEKVLGKKPFNLPVKHAGVFTGEFEVYDHNQTLVGTNQVTIHHKPLNLLHSEQTIEISGVINKKWTRHAHAHGQQPPVPRAGPCTATASPTAATSTAFATSSARHRRCGHAKRWWTRTTPWCVPGSSSSRRRSGTPLSAYCASSPASTYWPPPTSSKTPRDLTARRR